MREIWKWNGIEGFFCLLAVGTQGRGRWLVIYFGGEWVGPRLGELYGFLHAVAKGFLYIIT